MIYNIIDNVLDEKVSNEIEKSMTSSDFPWNIEKNITFQPDGTTPHLAVDEPNDLYNKKNKNLFYMTHMIYNHNRPNSQGFDLWWPLFQNSLKATSLLRMKANLYPGQNTITEHNTHIDYEKDGKCLPNISAIYYVNTNNGYTTIGEEKIDSIKNRLLIFDGCTPHSSSDCSDTFARININFNYYSYEYGIK